MRFIHLGDVHLGVKPDASYPWSEQRKQEVWDGFRDIIVICNREGVDLLLISGDFFHKQPLVRELKEVNYIFSLLEDTRVVIIAGNHDYISPRSNYRNFDWNSNVYMLIDENINSIYFEDINTEVYGFSYHKREIKEPVLDDLKIKDKDRINVLLAHGGTATNVPFDKKILRSKGFDYVALGHIHKPEKLWERAAYAGSIEPIDKTDIGQRGYILGDIETQSGYEESVINFSFVPHSKREYINVDIEVDDTMTNGSLQDLVKDTLTNYNSNNIFIINLNGYKDPDVKFNIEALKDIGNVIEVKDNAISNYDFELLYRQNEDNIIGGFIKRTQDYDGSQDIKTKALYYGIEALLHGKEG